MHCRPDRPSVPTPRRYGTQYGGAPSPGPRPTQVRFGLNGDLVSLLSMHADQCFDDQ